MARRVIPMPLKGFVSKIFFMEYKGNAPFVFHEKEWEQAKANHEARYSDVLKEHYLRLLVQGEVDEEVTAAYIEAGMEPPADEQMVMRFLELVDWFGEQARQREYEPREPESVMDVETRRAVAEVYRVAERKVHEVLRAPLMSKVCKDDGRDDCLPQAGLKGFVKES